MDFNYTLKYRTFDQLLEDVSIDLNTFALENMIEPQTLIKLVRKLNYDLGLRINQQKEIILEVTHGKVKLPDNFYTFNFALVCGEYVYSSSTPPSGTHIEEIPYKEFPSKTILNCCEAPVDQPCCYNGKEGVCVTHNPDQPYGDTCIQPRLVQPRVFMNCKGEAYELVQVTKTGETRVYKYTTPLRMKPSQEIDCDCPNLYYNSSNEGWIKHGFLYTTFKEGKVYLNYQSHLEDDNGNLLVPDHELLNEYYEYALKERILENLFMNGEDVAQRLQLIVPKLKAARNAALSLVNTPNFRELEKLWMSNRKAMYGKYYDMFKSYSPNNIYYRDYNKIRVL
jgi:hypothetical protein